MDQELEGGGGKMDGVVGGAGVLLGTPPVTQGYVFPCTGQQKGLTVSSVSWGHGLYDRSNSVNRDEHSESNERHVQKSGVSCVCG